MICSVPVDGVLSLVSMISIQHPFKNKEGKNHQLPKSMSNSHWFIVPFKRPGLQQQPRCVTLADAAPGVDDGLVDLQPGAGFDAAVGPEEAAAHGASYGAIAVG